MTFVKCFQNVLIGGILGIDVKRSRTIRRKTIPNRKFMTYADTHKARSTASVLANQQLSDPYGHITGWKVGQYYISTGKLAPAASIDSVLTYYGRQMNCEPRLVSVSGNCANVCGVLVYYGLHTICEERLASISCGCTIVGRILA